MTAGLQADAGRLDSRELSRIYSVCVDASTHTE